MNDPTTDDDDDETITFLKSPKKTQSYLKFVFLLLYKDLVRKFGITTVYQLQILY